MEPGEGAGSVHDSQGGPGEANGGPSLAAIGRALIDLLRECTGETVHLVPAARPVVGERPGVRVKLLQVAEDATSRNAVPGPGEPSPDPVSSSLVLCYAVSVTASDEDLERSALQEHELLGRVIAGLHAHPVVGIAAPSGSASVRFLIRDGVLDEASRRHVANGEVTAPLIFVEARLGAERRR